LLLAGIVMSMSLTLGSGNRRTLLDS
jgi:hypothetical protein